jgi:hypothetical protein
MSRLTLSNTNPLRVIEFIIGLVTVISGIYVLSPLLDFSIDNNGPSPLVQALAGSLGITLFGLFYTASGVVLLAGLYKRKARWRALGLFWDGLTRLYVVIATLLIQGLTPISWVSGFTISLICFTLWLANKEKRV